MFAFNDILQKIEQEITRLQFTYPPKSLYDPIEYILSLGGKRIRPALVLMACNLYKENVDTAVNPALGLEVFHNFTLLHDDLMDDAMLIAAYQLIGETESESLKEILDLFTRTALEICGGQQYDMEFESRTDVTEEEYIEMIRLKTAVLLACALKMGAIMGNAPKADAETLYQFGINIGLAFQLQDDLLDVYGDTATFGKNIGGDILCNKKTFMLINALRLASNTQKAELNSWIGKKTFDPAEKIAAVTAIYDQLRLKELTEEKIHAYYNKAMNCLTSLNVAPERLNILKEVSARLMNRQS